LKTLPIDSVIPLLKDTLQSRSSAVLTAQPGAGKTTRVPLALLEEAWLAGCRILMLEPRRLAARAAAHYMAATLGEQVGETVGYRVRLDTKVGPKTRIEVITDGVFTRMVQSDPELSDVGLVIFDEFHERSLQADLGLALCLQSQAILREDLRILVMSATLNAESVSELLHHALIISSEGKVFPVDTRYLIEPLSGSIEAAVAGVIKNAVRDEQGDILVFLPGIAEIRRVESRLKDAGLAEQANIVALYGNLSQEAQDRAISASPAGVRKIVLSTSIAETSLTVEGIRIVIDSGLMRIPRFSPRTGMTRLETVQVSKASADQRRGRAGRLSAGICYRLWTEIEHRGLVPHTTPEILEADLASLTLELAVWGIHDAGELLCLDKPPAGAFGQARKLLSALGAIEDNGRITTHGQAMAELGVHPRLAHMMLKAVSLELGGLACEIAAVLSRRDLFREDPGADLRLRMEALRTAGKAAGRGTTLVRGFLADHLACRQCLTEASLYKRQLGISVHSEGDIEAVGILLAFAYPDRIAQQRGKERFLMSSGRGAILIKQQMLSNATYLVAAELDDQGADSRIYLAAPVSTAELEQYFGDDIEKERHIVFDSTAQAVRARIRHKLQSLILKETTMNAPDPEAVCSSLIQGIAQEGLGILPWKHAARQLQQRITFMHQFEPEWPDAGESALTENLREWLGPHLYGLKSREDLQKLDLISILGGLLSWGQSKEMEELFPTHVTVPSGSRIPIDYSDLEAPKLSVRLQEMFGLESTPRIARGRIPLTLHLLSPAQRPIQVTQDLASFWETTYFEVKKDLKGRYPKHYWPDDPLSAIPTNRTRPSK
jgi:ATP-dependent helicase HrpB